MIRSSLSIARSIRHRAFSHLRHGGLFDQRCTVAKGSTQLGISVDKMGHLSESCVIASSGGSVVHVSVNSQSPAEAGEDFLPLTVDYRARMSAFGLIPEGTRRREKSPGSDDEILVARFIDRAIRPLFPSGYVEEVQVTVTNHATDGVHDPTVLALNATSAALLRSKQPWFGPVGCVRVGLIDGNLVVNPPVQSMKEGGFDLLYAGTIDRTLMIEAVGSQVSEDLVKQAIDVAHKAVREEIDLQKSLMDAIKSDEARVEKIVKKRVLTLKQEQRDLVERLFGERARSFYREPHTGKEDRSKAEGTLRSSILEEMAALPEFASELPLIRAMLTDDLITKSFRAALLEDPPLRTDGRKANEVRPIECAAGVLPSVHGSSYFARGDTHVLSTVTIGNMEESRVTVALDGSNNEKTDYFYLHYDFPPYCNGEVGALTLNRRMVGHGNLAERALRGVMPKVEKFPYVVRLMAECTSSNGSSSMASACSGTLALLEAGVPIAAPVAGISVGLVTEPAFAAKMEEFASGEIPVNGKYRILTDILGSEDHHGDMDFKIAGTTTGITAIQLDVKLPGGIPIPIIKEAIDAGKVARNNILAKMEPFSALQPMKEHAPRAALIPIDLTRMTHLLSNGAEVLKYIRKTFDVEVDITEDDHAYIFGKNLPLFQEAASLLHDVATTLKEGDVLRATVVDVKDFGVFVRVNQGQEALVHISHLSHDPRIQKTELTELLHPGQKIDVKITAVDNVAGIISASRRVLLDAAKPDDDLFSKKSTDAANDVLSQQFGSLTAKFPVTPARKWNPAYYRHSVATPAEIKTAMHHQEYIKKAPQSSSNNNSKGKTNSYSYNNSNGNGNGTYKGGKNFKGGNDGFQKDYSNGNSNRRNYNQNKGNGSHYNNNNNDSQAHRRVANGNVSNSSSVSSGDASNSSSSSNTNSSTASSSGDASSSNASSSNASSSTTSSSTASSSSSYNADNSDKTESR